MLGYAGSLAPYPATYFDGVKPAITGDIPFANLEGTLTDQLRQVRLAAGRSCYEFRAPPSWARYFRRAGFTIVSNANNHAFDFWQAGPRRHGGRARPGRARPHRAHDRDHVRQGARPDGRVHRRRPATRTPAR